MKFVDNSESHALKSYLAGNWSAQEIDTVIIPMLSRFNSSQIVSKVNINQIILSVAQYILLSSPFYALSEMRRGMLSANHELWEACDQSVVIKLYNALSPTPERVWSMVLEPTFKNALEARVFDYFRRFIFSQCDRSLCSLHHFITGKPQCGLQSITVQFHTPSSEFQRRPTSSTCSMTLDLPTTYDSFTSFSSEFSYVLNNSRLWLFDWRAGAS